MRPGLRAAGRPAARTAQHARVRTGQRAAAADRAARQLQRSAEQRRLRRLVGRRVRMADVCSDAVMVGGYFTVQWRMVATREVNSSCVWFSFFIFLFKFLSSVVILDIFL